MAQKNHIRQWKPKNREISIANNCYDEYCKIELDDNLYRNRDEIDAAIALLMLHYQDFQNCVPNKIVKPFKTTAQINSSSKDCGRNTKKSLESGVLKIKKNKRLQPYEKGETIRARLVNSRNKKLYVNTSSVVIEDKNGTTSTNSKITSSSSLLTSCRNILKEFLEQNGFQ